MKQVLFIWAILFSLFTHTAFAESQNCPPPAARPSQEVLIETAKNAKDHGFLWKITKGDQVSYLYGTIHIAKFDGMFPGPLTKQALKDADTIALELDMMNPDIQHRLQASMATQKGHDIPKALQDRIKQAAKSQCIPYENIAVMMPEMQIMTLQLMQSRYDALYTDYGIDMMLSGFGHAAQKKVVSLESPEMQMETLQMANREETIEFVEESLDQMASDELRQLTLRLYQDWAASNHQDIANYAEWCDCMDTEADKKYMERLIDKRNIKLAENIDQLHAAGEVVFAAVGALHMFGDKGLPDLMRKRGYRVERVAFQ